MFETKKKKVTNKNEVSKLDLMDLRDFTLKEKLKPVTSSLTIDSKGVPESEGLFSTEIFGDMGSLGRAETFSFIKFPTKVISPFVFSLLKRMYRNMNMLLAGYVRFKLDKTILIELKETDPEWDTSTIYGFTIFEKYYVEFLNYLNKKKGDDISQRTKKYISTLKKLPQKEYLIDRFLVVPAGLRDIDLRDFKSGSYKFDEINDYYVKLIRISNELISIDSEKLKLQLTVNEIHDFLVQGKLAKKRGLIKNKLGKKPVAFATRAVITAADTNTQSTWKNSGNNKLDIPVGYVGVPVSLLVSMTYPFYVHYLRKELEENSKVVTSMSALIKEYTGKEMKSIPIIVEEFIDLYTKDPWKLGVKKVKMIDEQEGIWLSVHDYMQWIGELIVGTVGNPKRFGNSVRYPITNRYSNQLLAIIPTVSERYTVKKGYKIFDKLDTYSTTLQVNPSSLALWGGDKLFRSPYQAIDK